MKWSPTENNILASATSADNSIKIWNVETASELFTQQYEEGVQSFDFSPDSALIATSNKDGKVYVYDPRTKSGSNSTNSNFNVAKQSRVLWRGER